MSVGVLALVLLAAGCHATWNLLAKGAEGGTGFVWLGNAAAVVLYLPVAGVAVAVSPGRLDEVTLGAMAVSGALHAVYFVLLQRAYRDGDLSVVYPLARGTGPIVATVVAILVLSERPGPLAMAGAAAIVLSVLSLARTSGAGTSLGVAPALATGVAIGLYTVWDKHAVDALALSPIVYYWGTAVANVAVLSPYAARHPDTVRTAWRTSRRAALGVGILSPLAYILVLFALTTTPVTYVAPARETTIVIASLLGAFVLGEGEGEATRRVAAAVGVLAGVVALALG